MRQISTRLLARFALLTILGVAIAWGVTPKSASAKTADGKLLVYYSMSYVGNAWQTEAKNLITAMALLPEYRDRVELRVQAAGQHRTAPKHSQVVPHATARPHRIGRTSWLC